MVGAHLQDKRVERGLELRDVRDLTWDGVHGGIYSVPTVLRVEVGRGLPSSAEAVARALGLDSEDWEELLLSVTEEMRAQMVASPATESGPLVPLENPTTEEVRRVLSTLRDSGDPVAYKVALFLFRALEMARFRVV